MNPSSSAQFRRRVGYGAALLLGIVAIANLPPLMQVVGGVAALVGSMGLIAEGFGYLKEIQAIRRAEHAEALRQKKKALRREREADTRIRLQTELQKQTNAESLRRAADAKIQEERLREKEAEAQRRYTRERAIQSEAERLLALEPAEFAAMVCAAFAGGNGAVEAGNRDGEYLCRRSDGTVEALLIVAENREATRDDVEALEAFRRDVNAEHGSLVSRTGFEADAVRVAAEFPITLTDPYLVARFKS